MPNYHSGQHRCQGLGLGGLTEEELDDIHQATLGALENTGILSLMT
jgi:trimethylamine:corrinoid methyltransferase-like protein